MHIHRRTGAAMAALAGLWPLPPAVPAPTAAAPRIWIGDESAKFRPADPVPEPLPAPRIDLAAAGGECVGTQILVEGPLRGLNARAGDLVLAGKSIPVTLARVGTIRLERPTGPDGAAGEWPDPLVPQRDAPFGEERNAFPIDVPQKRFQAIFLEACVPRGLGKGRARGAATLFWEGGRAEVPIAIDLRAFDLPATTTLTTAFGFSGYAAARGHGRPPADNRALTRLYDEIALRRGLTLFGGTQDAPPHHFVAGKVEIDWAPYDAEVAPFLDGTALTSGARWTSVELREPARLSREERRAWRGAWMRHFEERGWLDRLFVYVEDEPDTARLPAVEARARELREDAPRARRLVTTAISQEMPSVDLWVTLVNCIAQPFSATCPRPAARAQYEKAEAAGARIWWYQSCASHGCGKDGTRDPSYAGWPSYAIDAPGTAARAMGALAFANRIGGELYYDVVYAYGHADPWVSQWFFGGNGDGTLYYPGTPSRIGGKHDVPIESLRLVQISRGLADHAYLTLCARLGDAPTARREAEALAPSIRGYSRDPRAYAAMRERVGARIEAMLRAKSGRGRQALQAGGRP